MSSIASKSFKLTKVKAERQKWVAPHKKHTKKNQRLLFSGVINILKVGVSEESGWSSKIHRFKSLVSSNC